MSANAHGYGCGYAGQAFHNWRDDDYVANDDGGVGCLQGHAYDGLECMSNSFKFHWVACNITYFVKFHRISFSIHLKWPNI